MNTGDQITVNAPSICKNEIKWTLEQVLDEFLGIKYFLKFHDKDFFSISSSINNEELILETEFFNSLNKKWLDKSSLPNEKPLIMNCSFLKNSCQLMYEEIPVVFGKNKIHQSKNKTSLGFDIFGSIFFLLSRYEENIIQDKDIHNRFSSESSWSDKNNLLDRPLVNEYVLFLSLLLKDLGMIKDIKSREFKYIVTSDIDVPYSHSIKSLHSYITQIGGDLFKRKNIFLALKDLINPLLFKVGITRFDPFYKYFDWMMKINEDYGHQIIFYVMINQGISKYDGKYLLNEPIIKKLLKEIYRRGHKIGVHFSYESYKNIDLLRQELGMFKKFMKKEDMNLVENEIESRQHVLRWDNSLTPALLDNINIFKDSSMGFHNKIGFRSGVCFEYRMYDLNERKSLKLKQSPLVVMEASIFEKKYMNLKPNKQTLRKVMKYKNTCVFYKGDFNLLWHNNRFIEYGYKDFYKDILNPKLI